MTSQEKLESSKLRLQKAFEELEKLIKNLKKKSIPDPEIKQVEAIFIRTLNKINNKILEIKKLELTE